MLAAIVMLLGLGGGGTWWYVNGHLRVTKKCPRCQGEKFVSVWTITGSDRFKKCPKCEGRGRVLKWAARRVIKRGGRVL